MTPQEKSAEDNQVKAKDMLALGDKALADAKEMQELNSKFEKVQQELQVSQDESLELRKQIEELKTFKEKATVRP